MSLQGRKLSMARPLPKQSQLQGTRSTLVLGGKRLTIANSVDPQEIKKSTQLESSPAPQTSFPKISETPKQKFISKQSMFVGFMSPQSAIQPKLLTLEVGSTPRRQTYFSSLRKSTTLVKLQPLNSVHSQFDDKLLQSPKVPPIKKFSISSFKMQESKVLSKYMKAEEQQITESEEVDHDESQRESRIEPFGSPEMDQVNQLPREIHPLVQKFKQRDSIASNMTYGSDQTDNDEDFDVWDNGKDVRVAAAINHQPPDLSEIQNFLKFYKMRFGGFPGLPEAISNEQVIQTAVKFAGQNKRLFRKYFPTKQVEFDDQHDYSQPYDQEQDNNFHEFKKFCELLASNRRVDQVTSTANLSSPVKTQTFKASQFKRQFGKKLSKKLSSKHSSQLPSLKNVSSQKFIEDPE